MVPIVTVGPLGLARVAVDRDPDRISGDRLPAGVVQVTAHLAPVLTVHKGQSSLLVLNHQAGRRWPPLVRAGRLRSYPRPGRGLAHMVEVAEPLPDLPAGVENLLGPPSEVLGRAVPASLDVADVRRVETHVGGELLLGPAPFSAPTHQRGRERVHSFVDLRVRHLGHPSARPPGMAG